MGRRRIQRTVVLVAIAVSALVAPPTSAAAAPLPLPEPPTERSRFTPVVPARLLDTRPGMATIDGLGRPGRPIAAGGVTNVAVLGRGGVPATGVSAVVVNVTVTNTTAPSFLTVWPRGAVRPIAANLNFVAGQTVPNLVVAKVGAGGSISVYNHGGRTDVVVDVAGYFPDDDSFVPLVPGRLLDSRPGHPTIDGAGRPGVPIGAGQRYDLQVTGRHGVPSSGVGAVVLNVTATNVSATSYLTLWPSGTRRPTAANLSTTPGTTVPNLVVAKVGAGGRVSIYNHAGTTDVVVDIAGHFPTGGTFVPLQPARVFETRPGEPVASGGVNREMRLGHDQSLEVKVTGAAGVPDGGVAAVVLNITAVRPDSSSFLTVWPTGTTRPNAANLNTRPGVVAVPNLVVAKVGAGGHVNLYNLAGNTDVVVDVFGYFAAETGAIRDVRASSNSTCVLHEVGTLSCWGDLPQDPAMFYGGVPQEPFPGPGRRRPAPTELNTVDDAVQFVADNTHSCALRRGGAVWCWSSPNVFNLTGTGTPGVATSDWPQVRIGLPAAAVDVDSADNHSCALLVNATVWCWGRDYLGTQRPVAPWRVADLDAVTEFSMGDMHACALRGDGTVRCWGLAVTGTLGDGSGVDSVTRAVVVSGVSDAASVEVFGLDACAVLTGGGARCWGNSYGPTAVDVVDAIERTPAGDIEQVVGGEASMCVRRTNGDVHCGPSGPVMAMDVVDLPPTAFLAAGRWHICALAESGDLRCWGRNHNGQVGDGTFVDRASPRLVLRAT